MTNISARCGMPITLTLLYSRPLQNGDIVNIDVTVFLDGFHGDTSATFMVGDVDECGKTLVQVTNECLDQAIKICGPDVPFQEIGRIIRCVFIRNICATSPRISLIDISTHAANNGFTVSSELSGHGIGRQFHSLPLIYHHGENPLMDHFIYSKL